MPVSEETLREVEAALVRIANAPSEMIWGEDHEVADAMRKMESEAEAALAKLRKEMGDG